MQLLLMVVCRQPAMLLQLLTGRPEWLLRLLPWGSAGGQQQHMSSSSSTPSHLICSWTSLQGCMVSKPMQPSVAQQLQMCPGEAQLAGPAAAGSSSSTPAMPQTWLHLLLEAVARPGAAWMAQQQVQTPPMQQQNQRAQLKLEVAGPFKAGSMRSLPLQWLLLMCPAWPQAQASCVNTPASDRLLRLSRACLPTGWETEQGRTQSCSGR
jgi:hypothetical protein